MDERRLLGDNLRSEHNKASPLGFTRREALRLCHPLKYRLRIHCQNSADIRILQIERVAIEFNGHLVVA